MLKGRCKGGSDGGGVGVVGGGGRRQRNGSTVVREQGVCGRRVSCQTLCRETERDGTDLEDDDPLQPACDLHPGCTPR